jgi:hypothetical protein
MSDDEFTDVLEPKTNRTPEEVGREVFRLLQQHEELRVTRGETDYDVEISVPE